MTLSRRRHNVLVLLDNHDFWHDIWPLRSNSRSKDGLPDIGPKFLQCVCQNGLKRQLFFLGSLPGHDLWWCQVMTLCWQNSRTTSCTHPMTLHLTFRRSKARLKVIGVWAAHGGLLSIRTILVHVLTLFRHYTLLWIEFDLEGQMSCRRSLICKLPRDASFRLRPFWYVISGRYLVLLPLTLKLTFKMTLKIKMNAIFAFSVPNMTIERVLE